VGRTLRDERFAQRYDATVLAVQHHGVTVHERLADIQFRVGDLLLVHGPSEALGILAEESGFIPMGEVTSHLGDRPRGRVAVLIMAAVVLAAGTGLIDIMSAALAGVAIMVFSGCVRLDEIYSELDWVVVFLLAGLIPLGLALDKTGGAAFMAGGLVEMTAAWGPTGMITAFYIFTALLTAVVSNAATAVMLTPVAIIAATEAGMNPYALLVAVMFGASASFITPFGYQTNVMIYSPGGYRFSDFLRVGGPLNLLLLITAIIFIPIFWPS
jgi:di/tricarboxylate transporter